MERLHEGWLTKSPPEHKTQGPLKIFNSKWRKRYFVLYNPPAVTGISNGSCSAVLEYYVNAKMLQKKGSINLHQCKSISTIESTYPFSFVIRTMDRDKLRTRDYCLAAENVIELDTWIQKLCNIVGLMNEKEPAIPSPNINTTLMLKTSPDVNENLLRKALSHDYLNTQNWSNNQPNLSTSSNDDYLDIKDCVSGQQQVGSQILYPGIPKEPDLPPKTDTLKLGGSLSNFGPTKKPVSSIAESGDYINNLREFEPGGGTNEKMKIVHVQSKSKRLHSVVSLLHANNDETMKDIYKFPSHLNDEKEFKTAIASSDSLYTTPRAIMDSENGFSEEIANNIYNTNILNHPVVNEGDGAVIQNGHEYYNLSDQPPPIPYKVTHSPKDFNYKNVTSELANETSNIYITHPRNQSIVNNTSRHLLSSDPNFVPLPIKKQRDDSVENSSSDENADDDDEREKTYTFNVARPSVKVAANSSTVLNQQRDRLANQYPRDVRAHSIHHRSDNNASSVGRIGPRGSTKAIYLHSDSSLPRNGATGQSAIYDVVPSVNNMRKQSPRLPHNAPAGRAFGSESGPNLRVNGKEVTPKTTNSVQLNSADVFPSLSNTPSPRTQRSGRSAMGKYSPSMQNKFSNPGIQLKASVSNDDNQSYHQDQVATEVVSYLDLGFLGNKQSRPSGEGIVPTDKIEYKELDHDKTRILCETKLEVRKLRQSSFD